MKYLFCVLGATMLLLASTTLTLLVLRLDYGIHAAHEQSVWLDVLTVLIGLLASALFLLAGIVAKPRSKSD